MARKLTEKQAVRLARQRYHECSHEIYGVANWAEVTSDGHVAKDLHRVCAANLRNRTVEKKKDIVAVFFYTHPEARLSNGVSPNRLRYYRWLLNHKLFKRYWIDTTPTQAVQTGIGISLEAPFALFVAMTMLARMPDEFPELVNRMQMLEDYGMSSDMAYFFCHSLPVSPTKGGKIEECNVNVYNSNHTLFDRDALSIALFHRFTSAVLPSKKAGPSFREAKYSASVYCMFNRNPTFPKFTLPELKAVKREVVHKGFFRDHVIETYSVPPSALKAAIVDLEKQYSRYLEKKMKVVLE